MHREIERKFLVRKLPEDLTAYPFTELSQGYLVSSDDGLQVRLRKKGYEYTLTYKRGFGNVREEREVTLSAQQFSTLWPATEGKRLIKTRYEIPLGDRVVEIDFHGAISEWNSVTSFDEPFAFRRRPERGELLGA